jgi:hypothetical protein
MLWNLQNMKSMDGSFLTVFFFVNEKGEYSQKLEQRFSSPLFEFLSFMQI